MAKKRKKKWTKNLKKGTFTAKAKRAGMTPAQYQRKVLANKSRYSTETVRQAYARRTLVSKKMGGKRREQ